MARRWRWTVTNPEHNEQQQEQRVRATLDDGVGFVHPLPERSKKRNLSQTSTSMAENMILSRTCSFFVPLSLILVQMHLAVARVLV